MGTVASEAGGLSPFLNAYNIKEEFIGILEDYIKTKCV